MEPTRHFSYTSTFNYRFVYLRLIGDRSIDERDFGKMKRDRTKEMHLWMNKFKDIQNNEKNVKTAIISANNHYAGLGPMTAKLFAEMMIDMKNNVKPFPILDYKITSNETSIFENNHNYRSYKK